MIETRIEHEVHCAKCDIWSGLSEHEARWKMEGFELVDSKADGTARYKCCECGEESDSQMTEYDEYGNEVE